MRDAAGCLGWLIVAAALLIGAQARATQLAATLDNGLQVLVRERPTETLVNLEVFYPAGAAAEPDSLSGLAHVAEHLLVVGDLEAIGDSPRRRLTLLALENGASTSASVMKFEVECLPALLPEVLAVEAARMSGLTPDSTVFERERAVVLEELAYRAGGKDGSTSLAAFRACFTGHPLGRPAAGTSESVSRITLADVTGFIDRTIRPASAVVIIDGPVDAAATVARARRAFGHLEGGGQAAPPPPLPEPMAGQVIDDNPARDGFAMTAAIRIPLLEARDMVLVMLTSSRLSKKFSAVTITLIPGAAVVSVTWRDSYSRPRSAGSATPSRVDPDRDVQGSLGWFWQQIHGAMDDLAEPAKRSGAEAWLESAATYYSRRPLPRWTVGTAILSGVPLVTNKSLATIIATVGLDDLQGFMRQHLIPEHTVIAVSHGRDSGRVAYRSMAGGVARAHGVYADDSLAAVAAAEITPVLDAYAGANLLRLTTFELDNGIPVVCQHVPGGASWSLVGWRLGEPVPEARPGKRPGICRLYNDVAPYRTERSPNGQPPRKWPFDASFYLTADGRYEFGASGRAEYARVVATMLVHRLDDDEFNLDAWARVLGWGEAMLARANRRAANRASAWRLAQVLGEDHPAVGGRQPDPSITKKLKYKDMQKLHRRWARPTGEATLLAVGGVPADSTRLALEATFGQRNGYEAWSPEEPPPAGPAAVAGTIVTAMNEADVELTVTFPAFVPGAGWDEPGLTVLFLQQLVRQVLDSRLRQQEAWTYSAGCTMRQIGGWIVPECRVTCQPGQAPAVLAIICEELGRLATTGWTEDQQALAKLRLVSLLIRSSGSADGLAAWVRTVSSFGPLPADPVAAVVNLDPAAAIADLATIFPADRFVFSAVGAIFEDDLDQFEF